MDTNLSLINEKLIIYKNDLVDELDELIEKITDHIEKCIINTNFHEYQINLLKEKKRKLMDYNIVKNKIIKEVIKRDGISLVSILIIESILPLSNPLINVGIAFITSTLLVADILVKYNRKMDPYNKIKNNNTIESINNEIFDEVALLSKKNDEKKLNILKRRALKTHKEKMLLDIKKLESSLYYYNKLKDRVYNNHFCVSDKLYIANKNDSKKLIRSSRYVL